ncbi:MAG: agmatine deiminase family protein [Gammaproteobacteria bacterium]|nr:agmatine deiminase family protein [Gammaproteobacteria bacterium]
MSNINSKYTLLPEWAAQSAVMLTWPHKNTDWASNLTDVELVYKELVKEISSREKVLIVCQDISHQQHIKSVINSDEIISQCQFSIARSDDSWARDHGPITVNSANGLRLLNFQFNGWGNKYKSSLDNAINQTLATTSIFSSELVDVPFVLEGGSIETDGNGSLLTTENCLLSASRNPDFSIETWNKKLQQYFGTENILWLKHGHLAGDDTDSHIDTLARFCNQTTIAYCSCKPDDEHYPALKAMEAELREMKNTKGDAYHLIDLPLPDAIYDDGNRLPATYANFLIINKAVLVPVYNDPQDELILEKLSAIFTDREVIGINCLPIIKQYGSLHCLTMQLPAGALVE